MDELRKHPVDFDALQKGQEFTVVDLSEILGQKPDTDGFRFGVLGLQDQIHKRTGYTAKTTSDKGLRILTDPEASKHNNRYFMQHLRGAVNRHTLMIQVDVDNLTDDDRKLHDNSVMRQSRYVSAIVQTRKAVTGGQKKELIEGNAE